MVSGFPRLPKNRKQRRKPGPAQRDDDEKRSERITIRAHDDLMRLLTLRSDEAGVSRSHYIERLLIRWLTADPRNPKLDAMGRIVPGPTPYDLRAKDPLRTADRWQRFSTAHELLMGMAPPRDWFEDPISYWPATHGGHQEFVDHSTDPEEAERVRLASKKRR
jgi:hypothetical protein